MRNINFNLFMVNECYLKSIIKTHSLNNYVSLATEDYITKYYCSYTNFAYMLFLKYNNIYLTIDDIIDDLKINVTIKVLEKCKPNFNISNLLLCSIYDLLYSIHNPIDAFNEEMFKEIDERLFNFIYTNYNEDKNFSLYNLYCEVMNTLFIFFKEINTTLYLYTHNKLRIEDDNLLLYVEIYNNDLLISIIN